jgi:hypothetical protein
MELDHHIPLAKAGIRTDGDVVFLSIDPNAAALVAGPSMATVLFSFFFFSLHPNGVHTPLFFFRSMTIFI